MTEKVRHKHADLIIAWANGETIEFFDTLQESWKDIGPYSPLWDPDSEYRIKPNLVEKWRWVYEKNGNVYISKDWYSERHVNTVNQFLSESRYIQKIDSSRIVVEE
jgi:hypothetical protein